MPCYPEIDIGGVNAQTCSSPGNNRGFLGTALNVEPVHDLPEASALGLFLVALGGLGFMVRRQRPAPL